MILRPRISVCIDLFNYARFLPEAIESVLGQTRGDFELIVVDDRSTDDSYAVAERYAARDGRIVLRRNERNLGMVGNRNACLRLARADYVKFVHADDFLCSPHALERMAARLDAHPALALVACATRQVDSASRPTGTSARPFDATPVSGASVIVRCLREGRNLVGPPTATMFRRSLGARGFHEGYFHAADEEMWFHLLEQGCFAFLPEELAAYRWHAAQQTERDKRTLTQEEDALALLRDYLDRPYVRMKRFEREFLRREAVRRLARRARAIGRRGDGARAIEIFGRGRYAALALPHAVSRFLLRRARPLVRFLSREPRRDGRVRGGLPRGINVAGFFRGEYGIGESSRAYCAAVRESGIPHALVNVDSTVHRNGDTSVVARSRGNPYGVNLMTFSFDYARRFHRDRGHRFFRGRRNIGLWYWELETFPARWHANFDYYDEIWTPSEFCRRAIAAVSPIPVLKIPYPFFAPAAPARPDRASLGIDPSARVFLFTFDYCSTIARKNPIGLIEAFRRAFRPGDGALLVLKTINRDLRPADARRVAAAADGAPVLFLDGHLPGTAMPTLFASADVYVSLHRSEGLGLGMAQAMAHGKPVIATAYSGNLEFMPPGSGILVRHTMSAIPPGADPYEAGLLWAEPDLDEAAAAMRRLHERPDEAAALGARGRAAVLDALDPRRAIAAIRARLDAIVGAGPAADAAPGPTPAP
jgi:glycosyltransferase involved in cell wall biosynthesis